MSTDSLVTSSSWLKSSTNSLNQAGIKSSYLDSLIMLETILRIDRAQILSNLDYELSKAELGKLAAYLSRRLQHEPMSYITERREFYKRNFYVNKNVLVPRPESESFIDLLLSIHDKGHLKLIDIGSGSGCLGIIAKLEAPRLDVTLGDISNKALIVATKNAKDLGAKLSIIKGDLGPLSEGGYDIILANLPYIEDGFTVNEETSYEPNIALYGGADGLGLYQRLWQNLGATKSPPKYVLTESLESQHAKMKELALESGYSLRRSLGLVLMFTKN